jgi:hypothetical protein
MMSNKIFHYFEKDGKSYVVSNDKRQMARWYALDYLTDKAQQRTDGSYIASVSADFLFTPAFRKQNR